MRRSAFVVSFVLLASASACNDRSNPGSAPEPSAAPPNASAVTAALGLDAGFESTDPPPPAGDLKTELDRFVNLDSCVAERSKLDPLVGDALRTIGYDTFLRDACRMLEGAKDKRTEPCDKIDSSALRNKCRSWVAMLAQTPETCPLLFENVPVRGRSSTCLAVAGKDPRLCAGESSAASRATCEALSSRDEARCDSLLPSDRPSCKREITRWRPLLAAPLEGLPKLPNVAAKLIFHGQDGTPDPPAPEVDLASDFARGGVVVTNRDRARVELGLLGESEALRFVPSPNKKPRLGFAVVFEPAAPGSKDPPKPVLERLELEVPGEATILCTGKTSSSPSPCELEVANAHADRTRGGEVALSIRGKAAAGTRAYKVDFALTTFVRDAVAESAGHGARIVPPIHPVLGPAPH
ncbi:hypothetical protein AKJ09_02584 [Labilithrix luteola]|uniref:Lipoprotein n=1 Tax=Labilithrix luteola TaxID=1391654 RepID=A0A0K1PQV0_9BACT|nr:hypothetical protein [Labilithrix luteola]AKU95920.1 hypothetical protein AKJ09_02584 [Labilithrix luteola]